MSTNPVDVPDAVMAAFTSAFGSVAKVKELEAKIADLSADRDHAYSDATSAHERADRITADNDTLRSRLAELEAALNDATFREGEVRGKLEMLVSTFKSVVGEAQAAVELIEPPPVVAPETSLDEHLSINERIAETPMAVADPVIGNPTEPATLEASQTSETSNGNGWQSKIAEKAFGNYEDQATSNPTPTVPVDDHGLSATSSSVETDETSASMVLRPFSASSTTPPDTPAPPSSTESPATPSDTASSPSDTKKHWNRSAFWEKPELMSWNEWYSGGGLLPNWLDPNTLYLDNL